MNVDEIKEITLFCEQGDSAKISTWSNVPYFLAKTLEERGVKLNRVNLNPGSNRFHKAFYKLWNVFAKGVFRNKYYTYRRSGIYYFLIERRIRKALKQFPNADLCLFTTYNFSSSDFSDKPVLLFNDWTADYDARHFKGIDPATLPYHQRKFIKRQAHCIEAADTVVSLFPGMAADMARVYKNKNINYVGNVVNSLYEADPTSIEEKKKGCDILFVGKKHYLKGAHELLEAFARLREVRPEARLHIIGMKAKKLGVLPEGAVCYGYLDKGNPQACETYYELMRKCRLFINTTPKWGAFSASVEAMYHYMPVIITPYSEFVNTFGNEIDFGVYHSETAGAEALCREMLEMLDNRNFESMANAAHTAVADFKWDIFVGNMLKTLERK